MWAALAALVVVHEIVCEEGELLSEAVDRGLDRRPMLVYGFTAVTVGHLLNWLHPHADPYRWIGLVLDKLKGYV